METQILERLLARAKSIAVAAGREIQKVAAEGVTAQEKEDGSPLTRADTASHEAIAAGLAELEPKLPVLSEEGDLEQQGMDAWRVFWCVDPLDGTKEFVKGLTEYTVNIALVEDGRPVLGVVYVPAQDVLYYAAAGLGAWKAEGGGEPARIQARQVDKPERAVVSRSHLSAETEEFLKRLGVTEMVQHGSSIKICAVAEGKADIYPRHGPTCLWDTAAGTAIALEAGCAVVDLSGQPLTYRPADGIKKPGFIVHPKSLECQGALV
jgi:3'(2'), 5'-bisphosphate nucleotidase